MDEAQQVLEKVEKTRALKKEAEVSATFVRLNVFLMAFLMVFLMAFLIVMWCSS